MNRKLQAAVRGLTGDAEAWFALGQAAVEAGSASEAKYALLHAVELAPTNLQRTIDAGQLLYQAGCLPEAERLFRRVLDQVPDFTKLRGELARLLLEEGNTGAARDEAEMALFGQPEEITLLLIAADANERVGHTARAREHLVGVLASEPAHLEANRRLAMLCDRAGDIAASIPCWRQVVAQQGLADREAVNALGIALSRQAQQLGDEEGHDEALALLRELVRAGGDAGEHANLGLALLAAGRPEPAVEVFLAARSLAPEAVEAHCGLGLAYHRLGRYAEAAEAFKITERLAPDNTAGPVNLALALQAAGDLAGARAALARAAVMAPDDREIRQALERLGAASSPGTRSPGALDPSISGDLRSFQLFDVLELLRMQNKSGSLVVSSRNGAGLVRLVDGTISSASAPGVPPLGQSLVSAGLLSTAALDAALVRQRAGAGHSPEVLGALLLRERLIDEAGLTRVVFAQVLAALGQMSSWSEGAFSFHREQQAVAPPVSFSVPQVVLEVMRLRDEANHENDLADGVNAFAAPEETRKSERRRLAPP